jgi:invasion protein IalB
MHPGWIRARVGDRKKIKQGNRSMFPGISFAKFGVRALAVATALGTVPVAAMAQQDAETPGATPSPWQKVCTIDPKSKAEVCGITQELRAETGLPLSTITINWKPDEEKYYAAVFVPITVILPPGVAITVDGEKKATAAYAICLPPSPRQAGGCLARAEVSADFIAALKKGNELALVVMNAALNKPVPIKMSLSGFSKTFDGPAIDPAAAEVRDQQLSDALQKKAKEQYQKLIDQQQKELERAPN